MSDLSCDTPGNVSGSQWVSSTWESKCSFAGEKEMLWCGRGVNILSFFWAL